MKNIFDNINVCVFKVEIDDIQHLTQDEIILDHYQNWLETDIGEWAVEKNISIHFKESYKSYDTMMTVIPFYISLTQSQYEEYKEICFYKKLTE